MKVLLAIPLLIISLSFGTAKDADDFDSDLDNIVRDFKANIMDEQKCEDLNSAAGEIVDDIEDALDDDPNTQELKDLKKEAEALKTFISVVALSGSVTLTVDQFNLANTRILAPVTSVTPKDACLDIVKVTIGDFIAYMFQNNSTKNYRVTYKWKATTGMNDGSGEMGVYKQWMRQIYTNRSKPEQKSISVYAIVCTEVAGTYGY